MLRNHPVTITVLLIAIAIIATWHTFQHLTLGLTVKNNLPTGQYDMFSYGLTQTAFNSDGMRTSTAHFSYLEHYPTGDYTLFQKPRILSFSKAGAPWLINADQGKNNATTQTTDLQGHVIIIQEATATAPKTIITTTHSTYHSTTSVASTDALVTIDRDTLHLTGIGARVDSKNGLFQLLSQAQGIYTPMKKMPYHFSSDTLTYHSKTQTLVYDGHVTIDQVAVHITGNHLVVYLTANNKVRLAVDTGSPATYTSINATNHTSLHAKANTITYNPTTQFIYLDGDASIDQNHNTISASHIIYDKARDIVRTQQSSTEPLTHLVIMPQKKVPQKVPVAH